MTICIDASHAFAKAARERTPSPRQNASSASRWTSERSASSARVQPLALTHRQEEVAAPVSAEHAREQLADSLAVVQVHVAALLDDGGGREVVQHRAHHRSSIGGSSVHALAGVPHWGASQLSDHRHLRQIA